MKLKRAWPETAALVVTISLLLAGCRANTPEHLVMTYEPFVQVLSATGRLQAPTRLPVRAEVTAKIGSLPFDEGDSPSRGDIIATLDDAAIRDRLAEARAAFAFAMAGQRDVSEVALPSTGEDLRQLRLERARLERKVGRQETLHDAGSLALEALEDTRTALKTTNSRIRSTETRLASLSSEGAEAARARAAVEQAGAALRSLQTELDRYRIEAPFGGVVLERLVEPGELVQPGSVLLVLAPERGLLAEVEIDERVVGLIDIGQRALVWPEAFPSRTASARVDSLASRVDTETGTVRVRLAFDEEPALGIQDLTVRAEITVRRIDDALIIPASFLWREEPRRVLVAGAGRVEPRVIRTERASAREFLVTDGLRPGDIVLDPDSGLSVGDAVSIPSPRQSESS